MSYRIGSLNLLKSYRTESQGRIFYGFIYDLIADEGLDIVAFQEAYRKEVIYGMLQNLPRNWKGAHMPGSEFAFIWNSNRVDECSKTNLPQIFTSYHADLRMTREPAYGRFSPKDFDSNNEFRLIDIHIVHGGNDMVTRRKSECALSKGEIYHRIDVHRYGNFKRAFTVVLGDYNLVCDFDYDECNLCGPANVRTIPNEKTTLKMSESGYNRSYDHFSFDVVKNSSVPYTVSRIDAVNNYFNGDFTKYRENVSDHVPVKLEIL